MITIILCMIAMDLCLFGLICYGFYKLFETLIKHFTDEYKKAFPKKE